jgi:hypothetical protein
MIAFVDLDYLGSGLLADLHLLVCLAIEDGEDCYYVKVAEVACRSSTSYWMPSRCLCRAEARGEVY